ncbi:EAL domain-containing protein [Cytobacillus spongiae]|uniref:EAL domain-containing protein n=1 Tax=Cytobacillus spongiae TaxID=2901381 RepID=UPI001F20FFFC|nr:EAL domain-containing protein [Cytobacillus spongiae]UII57141.1 EAL domain-containing protein [Cytobacillus spongiae]
MNDQCIHCGIPFVLYEKGYLFIRHEQFVLPALFQKHNDEWMKCPFRSVEDLNNILDEIKIEKSNIKVGLNDKDEHPFLTYPLSSLYARVKEREIVEVIQHGELESYIQPIIELKKNQLYGYESLLRTGGSKSFSPLKLFQAAEETGLLSLLDQRAREVAIKTRKSFVQDGVKSFINFLPSTIYNPDYCLRHTFNLVDKYQINPNNLVFEVVETEKIEDIDHLKDVLSTYKREGMKVALDDVGAGFSTLSMLELLSPDYVKIDRHYIDHCDQSDEKQEFLQQVISLAKQLDIIVLAEGIEREEELAYCRRIGVDLAQGYFIGKPTNAAFTS